MLNTVLGTKLKMSQTFTPDGLRYPVTVVKSTPHIVTKILTIDKNGYWAIQLGIGERRQKTISKPDLGNLKGALKNDKKAPRYLREVKSSKDDSYEIGSQISPFEILKVGDIVKVTAISKGKGFAGGVKRHGFAGGPKTHGQSDRHRAPGSIGQTTTPGRVYKGKRMAGRMGHVMATVKNLIVLSVNAEKFEIHLSGPIPGSFGTLVTITKTGELESKPILFNDNSEEKQNA